MDKVYSPYLVLIIKECCNQTVQRFFECLLLGKHVRVDSGDFYSKNYLLSGSDILMISFSGGIMMKQV